MKTSMMNLGIFVLLLALACPVIVCAEDAMDFFPLDPGTKMINIYYNKISADTLYADGSKAIKDFNLRGDIGLFSGAAYYNVGQFLAFSKVLLPFGYTSLDETVSTPGGDLQEHLSSPSGLGDFVWVNALYLINDPVKGFFFAPDITVTAPTGEYNGDKYLNVGNNRWAFRPGLSAAKVLTSVGTFAQGKISAEFYTKNDDFTNALGTTGLKLEKEPLYQLQAFLTQFIDQKTFVSLDYFYDYGGETKVDRVKQDDKVKTQAVQFDISRTIGQDVDLMIKYRKDVSVENGPMTDVFGLRLTYYFRPSINKPQGDKQ